PLGLLLLALTGVGPLIAWRRSSPANLKRQFVVPAAVGGLVLIAALVSGMRDLYPVVALALAGFVLGTIGQEFYRGIRARRRMHGEAYPIALAHLVGRNRRRYGGYVVHLGIIIYFVAFTGMAFKREREATLKPGQSVQMESPYGHTYTFTQVGISQFLRSNASVSAATLRVAIDGKDAGFITSEKRQHFSEAIPGDPNTRQNTFEPSTEVGIRSGLREDLYVVFAGSVNGTEEAVYRININPLVWWVWAGGFVLLFGGLITMWPGGGPVVKSPRRSGAQAGYEVSLRSAPEEVLQ
ncbi:MAG TPA: cytochrome c-type biogenesis CcmF C-terminal domain-containing protein, partial [Gemmatimonadales bacterium]|nr:cytochrome c-type biogenesis CcmF C-terminal domain-containing protein [Gemmatimonadales bacterium]